MKVYRDRFGHETDVNETEILDVIKSISVSVGIRRNYALILREFLVKQSDFEKTRRNIMKCGLLTLFRIPSAIEAYICQMQNSCTFSVLYNSESLSYWKLFGVYFTDVPFGFDECTFIGEV